MALTQGGKSSQWGTSYQVMQKSNNIQYKLFHESISFKNQTPIKNNNNNHNLKKKNTH